MALKNFGFNKLFITEPRDGWPNIKAKVTSVGALDIIKKTRVFNKTSEATKKFDIIFAFSARSRDINKKHISLNDFHSIIKRKSLNVGLMFGPEASGLSNKDLSFSNYILQIPTSPKFKSLNLSHSLTLICYEIFKTLNKSNINKKSCNLKTSSKSKISSVVSHLKNLLEKKDFFLPEEKKHSMIININNLIYRLEPNDKELRILASIISTLSKK